MSELAPRITGTETEFRVLKRNKTNPKQGYQELTSSDLGVIISRQDIGTDFLNNGARFYQDINGLIEYATAEGYIKDTVAGEQSAEHIVRSAVSRLASPEHLFRIEKRVIDDGGFYTWGYHENYYLPQATELPSEHHALLLAMHLASRIVYTGAGFHNIKGDFTITQKLNGIATTKSGDTTQNKPLLNSRDESHTGEGLGKRLHITSGDPNMSPWATQMKLATTSLVLRLIESNISSRTLAALTPAANTEPYLAAKIFNRDPTLKVTIELENGKQASALDIQKMLLNACQRFAAHHPGELPEDEQQALEEWANVLDDLDTDIHQRQNWRIDWVAKLGLIQRTQEKHDLANNDPRLNAIEHSFTSLTTDSLGMRLRNGVWQPWVDENLVEALITEAPTSSRAAGRAYAISRARAIGASLTANWNVVNVNGMKFYLLDPYDARLSDIDKFFEDVQASAAA